MSISTAQVVSVFRRHGDKPQRALIRRLAKSQSALGALSDICTGDYPPSVVRWAVEALGAIRGPVALGLIKCSLKHPAMSVRLHAILGISAFNDRSLAKYLRPLLRDESGGIRVNALAAVGALKPNWLPSELRRAIKDDKDYVRRLAARLQSGA